MTNSMKVVIIGGMICLFSALAATGWYFSTSNSEIGLRNGIAAQQTVCESFFTQMWAIMQQRAGVTEEHREAFQEVYVEIMSQQPGADGDPLAVFLSDNLPEYDQTLYRDLANRIDSLRMEFQNEQGQLISMQETHTNMIQMMPSALVVGGRGIVEITVLSSERTETTYATGQENDLELFDN